MDRSRDGSRRGGAGGVPVPASRRPRTSGLKDVPGWAYRRFIQHSWSHLPDLLATNSLLQRILLWSAWSPSALPAVLCWGRGRGWGGGGGHGGDVTVCQERGQHLRKKAVTVAPRAT